MLLFEKYEIYVQVAERSFTMHDLSERGRTLNMENINEYINKDLIIMIYAIIFIILISLFAFKLFWTMPYS